MRTREAGRYSDAQCNREARRRGSQWRAEHLVELLAREGIGRHRDPDRRDHLTFGAHHGRRERAYTGRELFVADRQTVLTYLLELGPQRPFAGDALRTATRQIQLADQPIALAVGQVRQQHLAHRAAVGRHARTHTEIEIHGVLPPPPAAQAIDVAYVPTVEHRQ